MLHRHYAVGALNTSLGVAHEAVALLRTLPTSAANAAMLDGGTDAAGAPPFLRLRSAFAKVRQLQARVVAHVAQADLSAAAGLLHALHTESETLRTLAREVAAAHAPLRCITGRESGLIWRLLTQGYTLPTLLTLGGLGALAAALGVRVAPQRRKRPKVNID